MKYSIYICDQCHTWQPPPVVESLTSLFDAIKGLSTNANFTPKPLEVFCSKGCGKMREVTTEDKIEAWKEPIKKQEESTDLFTVVNKCMHNFPNACNVTAQSDKDEIIATYYADTHTWELKVCRQQKNSISIGETKLKTELQEMASKYNINLTKGWKVINHQYGY